MTWQKYTPTKTKLNIHASISAAGTISLTKGAQENLNIQAGRIDFAELYFNAEKNIIGIKFLRTATRDSLKLTFRGITKKDGFFISAKAFLIQFGCLPDVTTTYDIRQEKDMVVIDLNTQQTKVAAAPAPKNVTGSATLSKRVSYRGTKPIYYKFNGQPETRVSSWRELYRKVILELYNFNPSKMSVILKENTGNDYKWLVSMPTKTLRIDLWERVIPQLNIYFYTNKNSDDIVRSLRQLFKYMNIPESALEFGLRD